MKQRKLNEGETWCIVNLRITNVEHERLRLEAQAREISVSRLASTVIANTCTDNLFSAVLGD